MIFTKILCPTDFSDHARPSFEHAVRLAKLYGATLTILHAVEPPPFTADYVAPAVARDFEVATERSLAEAAAFARERGVPTVETTQAIGSPWRAIVDAVAADHAIDLVVMGTHGRTGFRRVLLGSVAEKVVRLAASSVLVVHPEDKLDRVAHVLCPTDFVDPTEHAAQVAVQLAGPDAKLELVHVVDVPLLVERGTHPVAISTELEQHSDVELERRAKALGPNVTWRTELGHVGTKLLELLDREAFDLVVTGSHNFTGLAHILLGSIAEKLVRHARCPVLVVRRRGVAL